MPAQMELATETDRQRLRPARDRTERLLRLAEHLPARERLLLEQTLGQGLAATDIARIAGKRPDTIRRQIAQLLARLDSPMYRFVASRFDLLPRELQSTARRHILEGMSLRRTAELLDMSLHQVRQHRKSIETLSRFM